MSSTTASTFRNLSERNESQVSNSSAGSLLRLESASDSPPRHNRRYGLFGFGPGLRIDPDPSIPALGLHPTPSVEATASDSIPAGPWPNFRAPGASPSPATNRPSLSREPDPAGTGSSPHISASCCRNDVDEALATLESSPLLRTTSGPSGRRGRQPRTSRWAAAQRPDPWPITPSPRGWETRRER